MIAGWRDRYQSLLVLLSCVFFMGLTRYAGAQSGPAAFATLRLFFVVRALIIKYNWRSEAVIRPRSGPGESP